MKKPTPVFRSVKALTVAAMLCALSVVIGIFCKNFLNFGNGLFRVTFENLPIVLSGFCFGPVVGGMVGVATDLISYLLSNQAYPINPLVTLGACVVGVVAGVLYRLPLKNRDFRVILATLSGHLAGSVVLKSIGLYQFYGMSILFRVPLSIAIAAAEAILLCFLYRRESFRRILERL